MRKGMRTLVAVIAGGLLMCALAVVPAAAAESGNDQDKDTLAYKQAYSLVLEGKWEAAKKAMDEIYRLYPNGSWADAARFWSCYSLEKLDPSLLKAFQCYHEFIQAYPDSKWVKDAKANIVRLSQSLAKSGQPEYETVIKSMQESTGDDDDIKMTALMALQNIGDVEALKTMVNLYDKSNSPKVKSRIVFMLQDSDAPEARAKLLAIVRSEPDAEVRRNALFAIGDQGGPEAVAALKSILASDAPLDLRRNALFALAETKDPDLVKTFVEIALKAPAAAEKQGKTASLKTVGVSTGQGSVTILVDNGHKAERTMAQAATYALAEIRGKEAEAALSRIMAEAADAEVRKAALYAMSEHPSADLLPVLKDIILKGTDRELAKAAVFQVAEIKSEAALEVLKQALALSREKEIRESALFAIAEHGGAGVKDILLDTARNSQDEDLAEKAIFAMGDIKGGLSTDEALSLMRTLKSTRARRAALFLVMDSKGGVDVKLLTGLLKDETDTDMQHMIIISLGETKSDEAVDVLLGLAKGKDRKLASAAVMALGEIGTPKAKAALLEIINKSESGEKQPAASN